MKFADELLVPIEIGVEIFNFCTTKTLLSMTRVCKSWRDLISSENIWKSRFKDFGIEPLENLLKIYNQNTYKDLHQYLTNKESLINYRNSNFIAQNEKDWKVLRIGKYIFDMTEQFKNTMTFNETTAADLSKINLKMYDSLIHYHIYNLSMKKIEGVQELPQDSANLESSVQMLNSFCAHNLHLLKALGFLTRKNCFLYSLAEILIQEKGKFIDRQNTTQISCSLIRNGMHSLLFTYDLSRQFIPASQINNFAVSPTKPDYKTAFVLEFKEGSWRLLDYRIAFNRNFYLKIKDILDNLEEHFNEKVIQETESLNKNIHSNSR